MARKYFTFRLDGTDDLVAAFDQLPKALAKSVLVDICNRAAKPIVEIALAPEDLP